MNKRIFVLIPIGLVILGGAVFFFAKNDNNSQPDNNPLPQNKTILFYGDGCPHCVNVDKFISDNKIEEKISFERKEVFNNGANAGEMIRLSEKCGLPSDQVGVPFLWDGSKCYIGDVDVINFFKQKAGIQ